MNKILVIKTSALGDLVHTYPVISYLRNKFPSSQIDWVVEKPFAGLVAAHPEIHRVLTVSTKVWRKNVFSKETWAAIAAFRKLLQQENYDVVFDLQGNMKSGLIASLAKSSHKVGFALKTVPEWPNILFTNIRLNPPGQGNIREAYLSLVSSYFGETISSPDNAVKLKITGDQLAIVRSIRYQAAGQKPMILVCPGSAWRNKQLPTDTLKDFLGLVQGDLNAHLAFIWGSQEEKQIADELHTAFPDCSQVVDKMGLPMLQNLMEISDLVIAMDSLPLHLAGTTHTPTFSVFGASSAAKYKPPGDHHFAFQGECPYGRTFEKRCPILRTCQTGACIRNLQAHDMFTSFTLWWKKLKH